MLPTLSPALLSIPLLGTAPLHRSIDDPQVWAEAVCVTTPVRVCEPRWLRQPFHNDSAVLTLGTVVMVATEGSAISLRTEMHPTAQLLIPYRGNGWWGIDGMCLENPVGESILYLPPAPLSLDNDITSGVSLNLDPGVLLETALTMAGPEGLKPASLLKLQQPMRLLLRDPSNSGLILSLYSLLFSLNQLIGQTGADAKRLRIDDLIVRMTVLLLLSDLRQDSPAEAAGATSLASRRRIEPLLEWIDANLATPICLSDLEARVHWSRRTLQYTFRAACGCTPMQWLRRRRLEKALHRLRNPLPGDTVASIGRAVGFSSSITFGREFRRQYGCSASSVMRATG
jgi:AraC-like DNA-binding protein